MVQSHQCNRLCSAKKLCLLLYITYLAPVNMNASISRLYNVRNGKNKKINQIAIVFKLQICATSSSNPEILNLQ